MGTDDPKATRIPVDGGEGAAAADDEAPEGGQSAEELLSDLEQQLAAERENTLRALADLRNFRRRAAEERVQQLQFANEQLVAELLPILDNFDRATGCDVDSDAARSLLRGVCMVRDQLWDVLTRFGLQQIPSLGAMFDPASHDAVERVETRDRCEGTIVEEVLPGYTLNGRVVRPAGVKVAVEPRG
jgi:molecular chaperone GrpE